MYMKTGQFDFKLLEKLEERDNPFRPIIVAHYVSGNPPEVPEYVEPPEKKEEKPEELVKMEE